LEVDPHHRRRRRLLLQRRQIRSQERDQQ
jgi:tmRNA-binding protein